jgi:hypothetical protein
VDTNGNITLPVNSGDPLFDLLNCYIDAFGEEIPNSVYLDPFTKDEFAFELFTKTGKYLGEDLFFINSEETEPVTTLTNEISTGNNIFNPFQNLGNGANASFPIASSDIGATSGSSLATSDIVWQFVDGELEGAWYKKFDEEFSADPICLKLQVGTFELRYPYGDRGTLDDEDGWSGRGLDNCQRSVYLGQEDQITQEALEELYWNEPAELSTTPSIALNDTTLIDDGAYADKNIFYADQIQVKTDRDADTGEFAWLYDFDHTELPIICGLNQIYWPLFRYDDETREFPFKISNEQVEDIALTSINLNKTMCGAVAGLTPETSDQFYKKSGFCGSGTEGAWLKGCDVEPLGEDIYPPAIPEELCQGLTFFLEDDEVFVTGSCVIPPVVYIPDEGCGDPLFTGTSVIGFENAVYEGTPEIKIRKNIFEWGVPVSGGKNKIEFEPVSFSEVSFDQSFKIGDLSYLNEIVQGGSYVDTVDVVLSLSIGNNIQEFTFPFDITETTNNSSNPIENADTITITKPATQTVFTLYGVAYTLEIFFKEGLTEGGFAKETELFANEQATATTELFAKLTTIESQEQTNSYTYKVFSFEPKVGFDYSLDVTGCVLTVVGDETEGIAREENIFQIETDGTDFISFYEDGVKKSELLAPLMILCYRNKVRSLTGASRQTGLHMMAPTGGDTHFFWEFPDSDITDVINGYDHDDYCEYGKLDSYKSIVDAKLGEETNEWKKCNCKAVYHSPIGNSFEGVAGFDDYKEYSDIIFSDSGVEPFSFSTWVGPDGKDYRTSDYFAVFKYSGREPDVGYGIGYWETLSGKSMKLERGNSYVYRRASFDGCDDNKPPCLVVQNCHCYDNCNDSVCKPQWTKLVQEPDGSWVDTGEPSDMILEAGQFYEYEKQGSINYTLHKEDGTSYDRTTPTSSFSMNVPFKESSPFWASSPTVGSLNIGLGPLESSDYLLTTQPDPSEIIIDNDNYIKIVRNKCEPFVWKQPLTSTIDLEKPPVWKKLNFSFTNPKLLQKIVGCGNCELVFDDTPDSCFLKEANCNSYIGYVEETNEDSDMIIRTASNCNNNTELYYSAQNDFIWTNDVVNTTDVVNPVSEVYVEAEQPWANYLNKDKAVVRVKETDTHLKTKDELGVFVPKNIGVNKLQCFGQENELV